LSRFHPPLAATVVGSYPSRPAPSSLEASYRGGPDPFQESLEESVRAQVSAGIELVSDGQTRDTMVNLFARGLRGVRMRERPEVVARLEWRGPITAGDQRRARRLLPPGRALKGIVTGPYTMSKGLADRFYGSNEKLAFALAHAMNLEARALEPLVDVIQFDEPFFSVEFPEHAPALVEAARCGIAKPVALHVCGDVAPIFSRLAELPVDVLDHEFAAHPELLEAVRDVSFRQSLGYGCVRSDSSEMERPGDVEAAIRRAVDAFGAERLMVDPDCGLRHLEPGVALAKLRTIVLARDSAVRDS
jgi:5-methyltetrahydropteroyltriglutamate--homocysteine methyltransferase